jgi:Lrp/AsnC family transcriptional regulator
VDAIDRKILSALQASPDSSVADLATTIGLSHTPCWRRLKKLEQSGVILGRAVLLDPVALDLTVSVFAELKLARHDEETLEAFEKEAGSQPEIVECFSMSGSSDYLLRIVVRSVADYEIFMKRTLLHLPGVGSVNSSFALKCIKATTMLPLDSAKRYNS